MIALYIIGAFLFLILVLCLLRISVHAAYDNGLEKLVFSFGFIKIDFLKERKPKKTKKQPKKKVSPPPKKPDKPQKKRGMLKNLDMIRELLAAIKPVFRGLLKSINISLELDLRISSGDAAKTGILYGRVCSAAGAVDVLTNRLFTMKKKKINIVPDFYNTKTSIMFDIKLKMFVYQLIYFGLKFIVNYFAAK